MFNQRERDLLSELLRLEIGFVVIGGAAVILHTKDSIRPRGDLDLLISQNPVTLRRLTEVDLEWLTFTDDHVRKLAEEGANMQDHVRRLDLVTTLAGVSVTDALQTADIIEADDLPVPVLSRELLIESKKAVGDEKDIADLQLLS
jgi:hypothetical protein